MRLNIILYIVVYVMIILFVRAKRKQANGAPPRATGSFGGASFGRLRWPQERERTTFNTTQGASAPTKPMSQRTTANGFPKPTHLNNSFGMGKETDDFITTEKRKHRRKDFISIGERKDIDCQLDERIFGSRHQNKDVF